MSRRPDRKTMEVDVADLADEWGNDAPTGAYDLADLMSRLDTPQHWTLNVLDGSAAGAVLPVEQDEMTVGRSQSADVALADDGMSRQHAMFLRRGNELWLRDLGSTNGSYVGTVRVSGEHRLEDGDIVRFARTTVRVQLRSDEEVEAIRSLYESAVRDPLTKLYNRRHLDERLASELAYAIRHRSDLSVLLMDLDHFKSVNDTHGHLGGDTVLVSFAQLLSRTARSEDVVARYGGEEFMVVLRGVGTAGAEIFAQRVRAATEGLLVAHAGKRIPITTSIGVATWTPSRPYSSVEALVKAADDCLYRAKDAGRNLVVCDASPRSTPPT